MDSKINKCAASTIKGGQCKKIAKIGTKYCVTHSKLAIFDIKIIGNNIFDQDAGGPGLLPELWQKIGHFLPLLELKRLFLTCKNLYTLFMSDSWFSVRPHYMLLYNPDSKLHIYSDYQCDISRRFMIGYRAGHEGDPDEIKKVYDHEKDGLINLPMNDPADTLFLTDLNPLLFVINSVTGSREFFYQIKKGVILQVERTKDDITATIFKLFWNKGVALSAVSCFTEFLRGKNEKTLYYPKKSNIEIRKEYSRQLLSLIRTSFPQANLIHIGHSLLITLQCVEQITIDEEPT